MRIRGIGATLGFVRARRRPYTVATVLVGVALASVQALHPILDVGSFLVFVVAVAGAASYGGLRPGFLATALAIVLLDFFFLVPVGTLAVVARTDLVLLLTFGAVTFVISWLVGFLQAARRRAERSALQSAAVAALLEKDLHNAEMEVEGLKLLSRLGRGSGQSLISH